MTLNVVLHWFCFIASPEQGSAAPAEAEPVDPTGTTPSTKSFQPAKSGPAQGEVAAVQPVMGVSQRVRTGPKQKKDLGTLGMLYES